MSDEESPYAGFRYFHGPPVTADENCEESAKKEFDAKQYGDAKSGAKEANPNFLKDGVQEEKQENQAVVAVDGKSLNVQEKQENQAVVAVDGQTFNVQEKKENQAVVAVDGQTFNVQEKQENQAVVAVDGQTFNVQENKENQAVVAVDGQTSNVQEKKEYQAVLAVDGQTFNVQEKKENQAVVAVDGQTLNVQEKQENQALVAVDGQTSTFKRMRLQSWMLKRSMCALNASLSVISGARVYWRFIVAQRIATEGLTVPADPTSLHIMPTICFLLEIQLK